jgi:tartrate dehydrogenase/decarboxylase/D-malate dehydrogenase
MRVHNIAAIPADGIGPEVIEAGADVLAALARRNGTVDYKLTFFDWGIGLLQEARRDDAGGWAGTAASRSMPSISEPSAPRTCRTTSRSGACACRSARDFDQYANVRPTKILPGITSPLRNVGVGDLDWVIVRENSEGEYSGHGGRTHRGLPEEVATEVSIFTRVGVDPDHALRLQAGAVAPAQVPDGRHQVERSSAMAW